MSCWISSSRVQTTFTGPSTCLPMRTAAAPCRLRAGARSRRRAGGCARRPSRAEGPRLSRHMLARGDDLGSGPHFTAVGGDMNRAVQRLHGRVRQKRHLVFDVDPLALRQALGYVADRFCYDAVFRAGGAQIVPNVARVDFRVRAFVPGDGERIESFFGGPHVIADDRYQVVEHNDLLYAGNLLGGGVVDRATLPPNTGHCASVANFMPGSIASMP